MTVALAVVDEHRTHHLGTWTGPSDAFVPERICAVLATFGTFRTHEWPGQGYSAIGIHPGRTIVLHTWPERRLATIDVIATDGTAERVARELEQRLGWTRWASKNLPRTI